MGAEQKRNPSTPEIILPKECQSLPLECQERLRSYLTPIKIMRVEGSLLKTTTPQELIDAISFIQTASQRLMDVLRSFKGEKRSWGKALGTVSEMGWKISQTGDQTRAWKTEEEKTRWRVWDTAWWMVRDASWRAELEAGRGIDWATDDLKQWRAFCEKAQEAYRTASILAAYAAARGAVFEIVKDQLGLKENPFLPQVELYQIGAFGFAFHQVNEEEKLFVDFPLMVEDKKFLGCLAFGDGESGKVTPYFHRIGEDCSKREKTLKQLFTPLRHFL